MAVPLPAEIRE